ncbi:uncharacterized protein GGS22DRAFT_139582 [Annulohypoxylon maeteangense]|uniref:uncharacterized protein n=1 Tax=Annulohypoxylon maeteangense TaxID=1927788 RepID=UPI0020079157|nr:uncharacterized protein GGS22DRAFT_139582 [Annulohypoxylon maeteangense]KAI0885153.1 hypothetical protein GGS22DRAFT_139582 [Annulohypoxylon maeteangense]
MSQKSSYHSPLDVTEPKMDLQWQSSSPAPYNTASDDPRSSSSQSLLPSPSEQNDSGRRKLLVIYIHGFMGNDSSFQSFPAHVHRYLKLALVETHVIHTKIYPRYKTYKTIDVARDNFSQWLAPHESPTTDVVLLGHSMGGMLAADIALMPSRDQYRIGYFLHRILGTVHLDVPLLGLHPGIITAGIASLFRPKPEKPDRPDPANVPEDLIPEDESAVPISNITSASTSIYSDPSGASLVSSHSSSSPGIRGRHGITFDPNFNPSFTNDVRLQDRGWWRNIVHFVEKHNSEGLVDAATNHIMSHMEFGGCLIDINGLKTRYENIRKLEDVDDIKHHGFPHVPPQIRFTQYYTVCHGYPKKPKAQNSDNRPENRPETPEVPNSIHSAPSTPQVSIQNHNSPSSKHILTNAASEEEYCDADGEGPGLQLLDPEPISEDPEPMPESSLSQQSLEDSKSKSLEPCLVDVEPSGSGDNTDTNPQQSQDHHLSKEFSETHDTVGTTNLSDSIAALGLDLPAIPELPQEPEPPNLEQYTDKDTRKQAEREAKRAQKDYAKLVKERERTIKERQKIFDKRKKKLAQETEKREKEEQKRRKKEEAMAAASKPPTLEEATSKHAPHPLTLQESRSSDHDIASPLPSPSGKSQNKTKPVKQPKERKFCNTPPMVNGQMDPKWVKIFMKDTDQVGAHTGLFFRGEHYERLVGDVGQTIVSWVQDDMTKKAVLEMG